MQCGQTILEFGNCSVYVSLWGFSCIEELVLEINVTRWIDRPGAYDEEEAAARAYDLAALKYWGPGTVINFKVHLICIPGRFVVMGG